MHLQEFADLVGVKKSTIQNAELGRRRLSEEAAMKVSVATGVSFGWLFNEDVATPIVNRNGRPYIFKPKAKLEPDDTLAPLFTYRWSMILMELIGTAEIKGNLDYLEYKLRATLLPLLEELNVFLLFTLNGSGHDYLCNVIRLGAYYASNRESFSFENPDHIERLVRLSTEHTTEFPLTTSQPDVMRRVAKDPAKVKRALELAKKMFAEIDDRLISAGFQIAPPREKRKVAPERGEPGRSNASVAVDAEGGTCNAASDDPREAHKQKRTRSLATSMIAARKRRRPNAKPRNKT